MSFTLTSSGHDDMLDAYLFFLYSKMSARLTVQRF